MEEQFDIIDFALFLEEQKEFAKEQAERRIMIFIQDNMEKYLSSNRGVLEVFDYKKKFLINAKSFVTPFNFQPPYIYCDSYIKREMRENCFKDWNPNYYVTKFCELINKCFENL